MISTLNRNSLPRKRSRANAKATSEHDSSVPTMLPPTRINVLIVYRRNGDGSVSTRLKLSQCQSAVGNHCGGNVKMGAWSGFSATVSIQPTGSRMKAHSANSAP